SAGTFSGFDNELHCAGTEPFLTAVEPCIERLLVESAVMLFAELHLHLESTAVGRRDNLAGFEIALGESLTAFDPTYTDVCAKVEVRRKFSLDHGDLKRSAAGHRGDTIFMGKRDFSSGSRFVGNQPARHRDFEYRHQMETLLQMARDRRWVVARIE